MDSSGLSLRQLETWVDRWNSKYPVGTPVRFYPVIGGQDRIETKTKTHAFILSGATACVFVEGRAGCVALEAVEPMDR